MDMDEDEDEDEGDLLTGLARPRLNTVAAPADDDDDDDDDDEQGEEDGTGAKPAPPMPTADDGDGDGSDDDDSGDGRLVGAEAAFALETAPDALELDPFRVAAGADVPAAAESSAAGKQPARKGGAAIPRKVFVGSLPRTLDDAGLVKFFARYGKVQEASVVKGGGGASRGFGFVTFVSDKGARFCLKEAGDPPTVVIDGRECTVRYAEAKDNHGARQHKMPARGNVDYLGLKAKGRSAGGGGGGAPAGGSAGGGGDRELEAPGVAMIAAAHKRTMLPSGAPGGRADEASKKRSKREPGEEKGIVTVSRRQDAEPLNKQPITMREIFPKEFWRI
jgi:hypothetical protein